MGTFDKKSNFTPISNPYTSIDASSLAAQKISKKLRSKINKVVREKFSTVSPIGVFNPLAVHIDNQSRKIRGIAGTGYNETVGFGRRQMGDLYNAKITSKEAKNLNRVKASLTSSIVNTSRKLKADLKAMLLQNISGKISFNEMVIGLQKLYPAYEGQIYTLTNTFLQRSYRDVTWAKENDFFNYFRYQGPIIETSREYCIARAGKVYTAADAAIVQATIQTFYNCQHRLVGITKEAFDDGVKGPV